MDKPVAEILQAVLDGAYDYAALETRRARGIEECVMKLVSALRHAIDRGCIEHSQTLKSGKFFCYPSCSRCRADEALAFYELYTRKAREVYH